VSSLEQPLGEFLAVRRALGYKLERAGKLLAHFLAWLDEQDRSTVTTELTLKWAMPPPANDSK
jgi:integrase/recombinase XerD